MKSIQPHTILSIIDRYYPQLANAPRLVIYTTIARKYCRFSDVYVYTHYDRKKPSIGQVNGLINKIYLNDMKFKYLCEICDTIIDGLPSVD